MTYFPFLHEERFRKTRILKLRVRASDFGFVPLIFFLDFWTFGPQCPHVVVQAALLRALPGALEKLGLGAPPERLRGWSGVSSGKWESGSFFFGSLLRSYGGRP